MLNELRRSRKANMPFAIIAVTILLIAGTYTAVAAYTERNQENADGISKELDSFDSSIDDFTLVVNRGMGEIIQNIGKDNVPNGLIGCSELFDDHAGSWMKSMFPMTNGVVTASLREYDVTLRTGSLRLGEGVDAEYRPTYLRATGTVSLTISSNSGSANVEINVSADSTSALPFLMENISLFDLSTNGERSLLTQIMTYQLTSLAQYRVLQGYGIGNVRGMTTNDILTDKDVKKAYESTMAILETIAFRTTGYDWDGQEVIDPAEYMLSNEGYIKIDMEAVFAQAIFSIFDTLFLKWLDYFGVGEVLKFFEMINDFFSNAVDKVTSAVRGFVRWITGNNEGSNNNSSNGWKYFDEIMSASGVSEDIYKTIKGMSGKIVTDEKNYVVNGTQSITLPSMELNISVKETNIYDWNGWKDFVKNYNNNTNLIRNTIDSVLKGITMNIAKSFKLDAVRLQVDPYDSSGFTDALNGMLETGLMYLEKCLTDERTLGEMEFIDPMYIAMYNEIERGKDSMFWSEGQIKEQIRSQVRSQISDRLTASYGTILEPGLLDRMVDDVMTSEEVSGLVGKYTVKAEEAMDTFKDVLETVDKKGSVVRAVFNHIITKGVLMFDIYEPVEAMMNKMVKAMVENIEMNTAGGVWELPGSDVFELVDEMGNKHNEKVAVSRTSEITDVNITMVDKVHYIELAQITPAAYSVTFSISFKAHTETEATSTSELLKLAGTGQVTRSSATAADTELMVTVVSGWALEGVDYKPSKTIVDDIMDLLEKLWEFILKMLEPIIKPLRELYKMLDTLANKLSSALMMVAEYVSKVIEQITEVISAALEAFQNIMTDALNTLFDDLGFAITKLTVKGDIKVEFSYMGFTLTVAGNLKEISEKKVNINVTLEAKVKGITAKMVISVKQSKEEWKVSGSGTFKCGDTSINVTVDPLMKTKKHFVEVGGKVNGVEFRIVIPEIVQYDVLELRLSELLPAPVAMMMENIPVPIPGMKGSIDAGVKLKYNYPKEFGLVINEYDSNPIGKDNGSEWVELYNASKETIDMDKYILNVETLGVPGQQWYIMGDEKIGAGEIMVITFPGQMLNNNPKLGMRLVLMDEKGDVVDEIALNKKATESSKTWQRDGDGAVKWRFAEGSKGTPNELSPEAKKMDLKSITINAIKDSILKIDIINDTNDLASLIQKIIENIIRNILESIIGCLVEASAFIEVAVSDISGTSHLGLRLAIVIGPELANEALDWLMGEIQKMFSSLGVPTNIQTKKPLFDVLIDNTYISIGVYGQISTPKILKSTSVKEKTDITVVVAFNLSSIYTLLGKEEGTWRVYAGVMMEELPAETLPPIFKPQQGKKADVWWVKAEFW